MEENGFISHGTHTCFLPTTCSPLVKQISKYKNLGKPEKCTLIHNEQDPLQIVSQPLKIASIHGLSKAYLGSSKGTFKYEPTKHTWLLYNHIQGEPKVG